MQPPKAVDTMQTTPYPSGCYALQDQRKRRPPVRLMSVEMGVEPVRDELVGGKE